MAYQPIENYGLIGNMRTAALVGMNGSIDWFCYPHFDSPSVFAAVLDDNIGGRFQIHPDEKTVDYTQFYYPDTNIIITRFSTEAGVGEVMDYMPVGHPGMLVRQVRVSHGTMPFKMICQPAFDYARAEHTIDINEHTARFESESLGMTLHTTLDLTDGERGSATATFTLNAGDEPHILVFSENGTTDDVVDLRQQEDTYCQTTIEYWHDWLSQCTYNGRWREIIYRSALALKLMTFEPTGAIIAAPTTSLPEGIGGERNWDYRYVWLRDAGFTVYALLRIGFTEEAHAFMGWINSRCYESSTADSPLQPMYGIEGRHELAEATLDHLEGYRGSKPVRIGNGAYDQLQLDLYGALNDAVYLYNKYGSFISYDLWERLRYLTDWVCDNWQRHDVSIWEIRSDGGDFTYSRLMCWVALDRALRLADKRSFPADRERWRETRDIIYEDIMAHGWNEEVEAFVQRYDGDALDASMLIMPLVFFVAADDPRMLKTIDAISKPIEVGGLASGEMIYRYNVTKSPDGLEGEEGTFNMCTFWLVEGLTRGGQIKKAREIFERMLTHANHLGLYAEQISEQGDALGNFPQAFTHLALISAAFNLDRKLKGYRTRK